MDKFKEKDIVKKKIFTKFTWYDWCDWLINYISGLKKTVGRVKNLIFDLFKTLDFGKSKHVKSVHGF